MILTLFPFKREGKDTSGHLPHEKKWIQISRQILEKFCGPNGLDQVGFRFWDGTSWPEDSVRPATCVLRRPSALRELLAAGSEMGAGEAYIRGAFEIEGDFIAAFELADLLGERTCGWTRKLDLAALLTRLPAYSGRRERHFSPSTNGGKHSTSRDQEAIRFHYDVSNAFYARWLDPRMVYSCA
jgi:cyclopropane-fatty-acyl-phospholipid synthase